MEKYIHGKIYKYIVAQNCCCATLRLSAYVEHQQVINAKYLSSNGIVQVVDTCNTIDRLQLTQHDRQPSLPRDPARLSHSQQGYTLSCCVGIAPPGYAVLVIYLPTGGSTRRTSYS